MFFLSSEKLNWTFLSGRRNGLSGNLRIRLKKSFGIVTAFVVEAMRCTV